MSSFFCVRLSIACVLAPPLWGQRGRPGGLLIRLARPWCRVIHRLPEFRHRPQGVHQVEEGQHRVPEKHARPGISHDRTNPGPHLRPITVHRAFCACRLICAKGTPCKPLASIRQKLGALATQALTCPVHAGAVQVDHRRYRLFFATHPHITHIRLAHSMPIIHEPGRRRFTPATSPQCLTTRCPAPSTQSRHP